MNSFENSSWLTDRGVIELAETFPNLRYFSVRSNAITDAAMEAVLKNCHNLQQYETGVTSSLNEQLRGTAIRKLTENLGLCPHLRKIHLAGYSIHGIRKILKTLSMSRKGLHIKIEDQERSQSNEWQDGKETIEHGKDSKGHAHGGAESGGEPATSTKEEDPQTRKLDDDVNVDDVDSRVEVTATRKGKEVVSDGESTSDQEVDNDVEESLLPEDARALVDAINRLNTEEGAASSGKKKRKAKKKKPAVWSIRPDNSPKAVTFNFAVRIDQRRLVPGIEQVKFDNFPVTE